MKVAKFKEDLQHLATDQLKEKLDQLQREQFGLRLNSLTAHVKDYAQFKKVRKNIARVLTCVQQKEKAQG